MIGLDGGGIESKYGKADLPTAFVRDGATNPATEPPMKVVTPGW